MEWKPGKAALQCFVTHYATTEPPKFPVEGGTLSPVHSGTMATPERGLRVAYDFARQAVNVEDPPLLIVCSSVADPTRAPRACTPSRSSATSPTN